MFHYILIFWYPCRDWLAGNSQAFPGPDATIRAIPDKNYSSIYLHTLASICKKVLSLLSQAVATWENNNNMKVKTLSNTMTQHLYFHDKENIFHYTFWSSYNFIVHLYVLLYCTYYITVVLFIVPLSAKLSALPVLVLVHVLVFVLWLIPMQSSHLPSARAHLDRRS